MLRSIPSALNYIGKHKACLLLAFTFVLGCGPRNPPTYPVQGRVFFDDGEPVRIGSVEFRLEADQQKNEERMMARGKISVDGSFELTTFEPNDGALEGTHQVTIHQMIIAEDLSFKSHGHGRRVSPKYSDYSTSGLTATVKAVPKKDSTTNRIELKLKIDPNDKKGKSK